MGFLRRCIWPAVLVLGWMAVAASYYLVLPLFGVLSAVTWALTMICWLWVIGVPIVMAVKLARRRAFSRAVVWSLAGILAGAALWTWGFPQRTPLGQFTEHRNDLARLADEYREGRITEDPSLPWRMRFLSVDGQAHVRCGSAGPEPAREHCALFLLTWQNWRHEDGAGLAYYVTPPGPHALLATAEGDVGRPIRELGAGWWVVG